MKRWTPLYTVAEVRAHVLKLHDGGMSFSSIARRAGIAKSETVGAIAAGKTWRCVNVKTAEGILGLTLDDRCSTDRVPAALARRLIEEIAASGIPTRTVSSALGLRHHQSLWTMCNPRRRITRRQFDRVAFVYRYLAMQGIVPASLLEEVGA